MKRKLQVMLNDEAWGQVENLVNLANEGFESGSINYSDAINEMVLTSKVEVKSLQLKHTNVRKSLRVLATQKDLDIDAAIKSLMELKSKVIRKQPKQASLTEAVLK
jgi:hypothetical protein